jgi:hypothetical protein
MLPKSHIYQIYKYVFMPSTFPEGGLVPSTKDLSDLALLYTCHQIYYEASYLAYSFNFSVTNRWHRDDLKIMRSHLINRPGMPDFSIRSLELVTPWTKRHIDFNGHASYLDSICDFEAFIWNVLELFEDIEMIIIDVPRYREPRPFAETLKYRLDLTIHADKRRSFCSDISLMEWMNWGLCEETATGLAVFGKDLKQDRAVQIICQYASNL